MQNTVPARLAAVFELSARSRWHTPLEGTAGRVGFRALLFLLATSGFAVLDLAVAPWTFAFEPDLWVDRPLLRVDMEGLRATRRHVLERELRFAPGERVDWQKVEADRVRLLDLGLFAEVTVAPRHDASSGRPVLIYHVEERPHVLALPIVEHDPEEGWSYGFTASHQNARGRAERAGVSAVLGDRRAVSIGYFVPWIFGRRLGVGGSAFYRNVDKRTERIEDRRHGFSLVVEPAANYETRSLLFGGAEEVRTEPLDASDPLAPLPEREDHRWFGAQISLDTREYRVRARQGIVTRGGVTRHGGPLGGDTDLWRWNGDLLATVPTGGQSAFTAATRVLWTEGKVPRYLRVNLGGIDTLRGYAQGEFGGESRWIGWLEERLPVLPKRSFGFFRGRRLDLTVDAVLFVDAGTVWEGSQLRESEAKLGGGAGLRFLVPFVQALRVDVATDGEVVRVYAAGGARL